MGSESSFKPVINLGNSIVGVSILALPYCFSQCGVVLGFLLVFCTALLTIWSCKMLIRAANMTRSHTYETLALAVFNKGGKLIIEISIIALNIGTCIAYFVIIGDLAPPILAKLIGIHMTPGTFRAVLLILSAMFIAFPLGLLRNVDSLSAVSISSLLFYFSLTAEVVYLSRDSIFSGVWRSSIIWWNSSGILKTLPIISLAFACHTQMFVIYSSLHDPGVRRMSGIAEKAIWLICTIYIIVGVFGYTTYCDVEVKGDILSNFSLDLVAQLFRLGFSLSVVLSFPLMIFPCRASIYSLFFSQAPNELHVQEPIPQNRFVAITAGIVASTVVIAILIPNIETVLALTGATTGSLICFIFPGLLFLKVAGSSADFSNRAKLVLVIGLVSMVLSTAVVIHSESTRPAVELELPAEIEQKQPDIVKLPPVDGIPDEKVADKGKEILDEGGGGDDEKRKEPALPQLPPVDDGGRKVEEVDKPVEIPIEPVKPDNPAGNVIDIPPNGGKEEHKVQELPIINDDKVREEEEGEKDVPRKREQAELKEREQDGHVREEQKVKEGGGGGEGKGEEKVVEGDEEEGAHERIAEHLEKLNDRVEKLEMENQQLREKQEVIERIQIQQGEDEGEGDGDAQGGDKMAVQNEQKVGLDNKEKAQDVARAGDLKAPPAGGGQEKKIEIDKEEQAILDALEREKEEKHEEVVEKKGEHGVAVERREGEGVEKREHGGVVERREAEGVEKREHGGVVERRGADSDVKKEEGIAGEHQEGEKDRRVDDKVEIGDVRQLEVEAVGENAGNMAAPKVDKADNQPPPPKDEDKYKRRDILNADSVKSR